MEANMTCLFSLIKFYFDLGLRHCEIVLSLSHIDDITIIIYLSPFSLSYCIYWSQDKVPPKRSETGHMCGAGVTIDGSHLQVGCSREVSR